jgi:hypothetical protein
MYCKKSHEHLTNHKIQSPYIRCNSKENNQSWIHIEHHIQSNKFENNAKINEHQHKSI